MGGRDFRKRETKKQKKGAVKPIQEVPVQIPEVEVIRKPRKVREESEE
jgi:hypothetical protein